MEHTTNGNQVNVDRLRSENQKNAALRVAYQVPSDWRVYIHKRPTRISITTRDLSLRGVLEFGTAGAIREVYSPREHAATIVRIIKAAELDLELPARQAIARYSEGRTLASRRYDR